MSKLNFFQNRPKAERVDINAYLKRIKTPIQSPSLRYLKALQKAHLLHVPFENLDIHYGTKIILDYQKIFRKIILSGRGGFCYELNGLFYLLLSNLGFECKIIEARVKKENLGEWGKPFDHMAILVNLDDQDWLVDVGFGRGPINPLKINPGEVQMDYTRYWKIEQDPDERLILRESGNTSYFESRYLFTKDEKQQIAFLEMCEYHQSSADSTFTQKKLITKLTPQGRVTLTDRNLKIEELGKVEELPILHEDAFLSKLEQHFGIKASQLIRPQE